jgi:hypothetical protein
MHNAKYQRESKEKIFDRGRCDAQSSNGFIAIHHDIARSQPPISYELKWNDDCVRGPEVFGFKK